jgi:Reverse transcriptase (RNA-dependent DNA polymerase)
VTLPDYRSRRTDVPESGPEVSFSPQGLGVHPASTSDTTSTQETTQAPQNQQGCRRSARGWRPSAAALESIASQARTGKPVDDVNIFLEDEDDSVHQVSLAAARNEFFQLDLAHATQAADVPRSFAHVRNLPDGERAKWIEACRRECRSHLSIPSISGKLRPEQWTKAPPVRLTWVFAKKDVYKARIVMLGQHMLEGVHFNDTHAPVPSVTCVRVLLAITASSKRHLAQLDVKTAFLNAPIDIELDVILPEGFGTGQDDDQFSSQEGRRRRALTAIPGCPQGSRVWRQEMVGYYQS